MFSFYSGRYKANQRNGDPGACPWRGREKKSTDNGEVCGSRWTWVGRGGWAARPRRSPGCTEPRQRSGAKRSAAFLQPHLPTWNTFCAGVMPCFLFPYTLFKKTHGGDRNRNRTPGSEALGQLFGVKFHTQ